MKKSVKTQVGNSHSYWSTVMTVAATVTETTTKTMTMQVTVAAVYNPQAIFIARKGC